MVSGVYLKESAWNAPTLEETRQDHDIRVSVAIAKLSLGRDIRKMNNKKEKSDFLKIIFLCIFYFLA